MTTKTILENLEKFSEKDLLIAVLDRIDGLKVMTEKLPAVAEVVASSFESDPHQFSTRPCATCRSISAALGRPFGCVSKRQSENE